MDWFLYYRALCHDLNLTHKLLRVIPTNAIKIKFHTVFPFYGYINSFLAYIFILYSLKKNEKTF